jgi:hypothetical protein
MPKSIGGFEMPGIFARAFLRLDKILGYALVVAVSRPCWVKPLIFLGQVFVIAWSSLCDCWIKPLLLLSQAFAAGTCPFQLLGQLPLVLNSAPFGVPAYDSPKPCVMLVHEPP